MDAVSRSVQACTGGAGPATPVLHEWCMKRNCSLTPRQALLVYALLSAATLAIALAFTLRGAWMVLAFALVETTAVGAALYYYARHALDQECIRLGEGWLLVEQRSGPRAMQLRLDPHHTRVSLADPGLHTLIVLEARGERVEVGRYLTPPARLQVAHELCDALRPGSLLA